MARTCALLLLLVVTPAAHGATFAVTSGADDGPGTLRQAIADAAASEGLDRIAFDEERLVVVASELPPLTGPLEVDGRGSVVRGSSVRLGGGVTATALGVEAPYALESTTVPAPSALGVRRLSDGVVRITGSLGAPGAVEVFGAAGANFLGRFDGLPAGPFAVAPVPEPVWAQAITATATTAAGTSGFAPGLTPGDLTSPTLDGARTLDTDADGLVDALRLRLDEPVDDAAGLALDLAGLPGARVTTGAAADDAEIDVLLATALESSATPEVVVAGNSAIADGAGNQLLVGDRAVAVDAVAPGVRWALATSRTHVRVRFSEPLASTPTAPPVLTMAGVRRTVVSYAAAEDGRTLEIDAQPEWPDGAAGEIALDATLRDAVGNAVAAPPRVKVWAAPGDLVAPRLTRVRLAPRKGRPGGTVRFTLDEQARVSVLLRRGRSKARSAIRVTRPPGRGRIVFGDRVEGRRLVPGRYTLTVVAHDAARNRSRRARLTLRVRHR